ncbi:hypothetical protein [Spartinivicinus poritis]|uniref:DUF4129 domain-containing protein n=1 Tax=Spartinivicinus poritis TaxID=2994640 RepID=A0ABT5UGS6_9GAMM|nr:hypothetical protein [Spartinivicinus sp. A2-2]MDE1465512.1 hypothetical protein [Spartinivicinus sp. A2-2]
MYIALQILVVAIFILCMELFLHAQNNASKSLYATIIRWTYTLFALCAILPIYYLPTNVYPIENSETRSIIGAVSLLAMLVYCPICLFRVKNFITYKTYIISLERYQKSKITREQLFDWASHIIKYQKNHTNPGGKKNKQNYEQLWLWLEELANSNWLNSSLDRRLTERLNTARKLHNSFE